MYHQNIGAGPNQMEYNMDYNNLAGDGGTDAMPQHVYQGLPSSSPFEYPADARDDFSTHSGTLSIPLSQPMAHGHVHYTVHHHSFMPLTLEHGTYGSMPNLHAHPHLTSSSSHGPLGLGAFESTTAASEYSYSDGYESGVTNEMSSRHSSYSPTSDVYSFPSAQTTQSYLNVGQHTGSSRSPGMSSRSLSDRRARPSSLSASPNLSYKVTKLPTPDHPSKAGSASVKKARSRKPFEPERRLEVRRMRQTGACFRCRWLKKPCGVGTPCPQCVNVRGRVWTYPCMRVNMTDLTGLSDIGLQSRQRNFLNSNIMCWVGSEAVIQITHGFGGILRIAVEEIVPRDVHSLIWKWPPSNKLPFGTIWRWYDESAAQLEGACYETTTMPYAIRKFQISEGELDIYLDCDRGFKGPGAATGVYADSLDGMGITKALMQMAWDYSEITGVSMIKKALRVKTAVYLQNYLLQCEANSSGPTGSRAIAPAFVQVQLDLLIDGRRAELEKEILAELQRTVFSRKRKCWLTIFFTIYILLTTLERTLWNHYTWKAREWVDSDFSSERAQEINDVLVAVFKAINQGSQPLTKAADGDEIATTIGEEYGAGAAGIFRSVAQLLTSQAPLLVQRKDTTFVQNDPFCLEGRYTSTLLLV